MPNLTLVPHMARTTYWDMIEYLRDFLGADAGAEADRIAKRSIAAAYREVANAHNWTYFYAHGRLQTYGFYNTGTIQFQVSSGAMPNYITLMGGTWPAWAGSGGIRLGAMTNPDPAFTGTIIYDIDQRIDDTHLTLKTGFAPIKDVTAGTAYTLFQDTYTLPEDFISSDQGFAEVSWGGMEYVHPSNWLRINRFYQSYSNTPRFWTVRGDPKVPGRLAWSIFPYPDTDRTIDLLYKRKPRKLLIDQFATGLATVDATGAPTTIVGSSGAIFTGAMAGSILRLSTNSTQLPTGLDGINPYVYERNIVNVTDTTHLQMDDAADASWTGVAYRISDPIDIEDGAMHEAFVRCCEKHAAIQRNYSNKKDFTSAYDDALMRAKDADSRSFRPRVAGETEPYYMPLRKMPIGPDIS